MKLIEWFVLWADDFFCEGEGFQVVMKGAGVVIAEKNENKKERAKTNSEVFNITTSCHKIVTYV